MEGKIVAFTNTPNVVVNNDFWSKANSMLSSYLVSIESVKIPEKPGASEMELPWIYEIMDMAIPELFSAHLALLDGDMKGQLVYNLAVGALLSTYPVYGSVIAINDSETQDLIKECADNPYAELSYEDITIVETVNNPIPTEEAEEPYSGEIALSESIGRILAAKEILGTVVIDNNIDPRDTTLQILLGILYYLKIEVLYQPENSNAFIDFITAS